MYFISTIKLTDCGIIDDQRPVGYYYEYKDAEIQIENNRCDIFECGYYKYAVIIKIDKGLYPNTEEMQWFEFCKITDSVIKIDKPQIDFDPYIIG
jgi:hypothetical protein